MKYIVTKTIGKGAFGVVYLAKEEKTDITYAIKETYQDPNYKNREAQIVKNLNHPNVIKVHHIFFSQKARGTFLHLVMDHLSSNLFEFIQKYKRSNMSIPIDDIRLSMYQICRGMSYIHGMGICHRDIKPQNILINPDTLKVSVCDFGSAKSLVDNEWNKTYICSRFYRAPELLFQSNYYTTAVDIWSIGCVMAELFRLSPLFAAADTDGQIVSVAGVLGPVHRDHIKVFRLESSKAIPTRTVSWESVLRYNDSELNIPIPVKVLLSSMITYDCVGRVNAFDALKFQFFDVIRESIRSEGEFYEKYQFLSMTEKERKKASDEGWPNDYIL